MSVNEKENLRARLCSDIKTKLRCSQPKSKAAQSLIPSEVAEAISGELATSACTHSLLPDFIYRKGDWRSAQFPVSTRFTPRRDESLRLVSAVPVGFCCGGFPPPPVTFPATRLDEAEASQATCGTPVRRFLSERALLVFIRVAQEKNFSTLLHSPSLSASTRGVSRSNWSACRFSQTTRRHVARRSSHWSQGP